MAEKPRLKKSDEILGSIVPESSHAQLARAKRDGGRAPDKHDGQARREQDTKASADDNDFIEEEIELTADPILPSAQSLAEKLLPRRPLRQRNFGAYEASDTSQRQASNAQPEHAQSERRQSVSERALDTRSEPRPAQSASIEFGGDPAPNNTAAPASVEFQAAPRPSKPATIEFEAGDPVEPDPQPRQPARGFQTRAQASPQTSTQSARPAPPAREADSAPVVTEYTFQSFEEPAAPENTGAVWEFSTRDEGETRSGRAKREPRESGEPFAQQPPPPPQDQAQPQPRRERIIQPLRTERPAPPVYEPPQQQAPPPPPPQAPPPRHEQTPAAPPEPEMSEAERSRQEFLKRIANQFEVQFEEKFEDGAAKTRENPSRSEPREPLFMPEPKPKPQPRQATQAPATPGRQTEGEDFLAYVQRQERERRERTERAEMRQTPIQSAPEPQTAGGDEPALDFIHKFEKDVREEETQRTEDFKETLSQKFMRERERYLRELGGDDVEPEPDDAPELNPVAPPAAQPRRRLDFQIQPEMHMQNGNIPYDNTSDGGAPLIPRQAGKPAGPVTYTRGGAARPQTAAGEVAGGGISLSPTPAAGGKKTGEQLLMELSMNTRAPTTSKIQPAKLKFTFETPEEHAQKAKGKKEGILPAEKWPRRIVFIAMAAGLFALGLVVWSMVSYYNLSSGFSAVSEQLESELPPVTENTLDVYNDRVFTQTASINNVIFKNAGTLLKNAHVKDYVVIDGVDGTGRIRLEDVTVDSAISVKSNGVDTLELHNVKAARLIINNPQTGMTISATGNTDIDIVELRTTSTVKQSDIGIDYAGVRGVIVTSPEAGGEVNAKLDGLNLRSLETDAGTAILAFENNTRAETASSYGSLSLSGNGRISTLSIGAKVGQGAGDIEDRKDVVLFVKDVSITNLNIKSPASLNLSTTVDSISTSDAITLGGEASVGSLTLNPKADSSSRLLIDIVSANIQSVYSNTQSRINVTGTARVNELTADASTYALGNKVNHLRVNADGVIYENEPDKIDLSSGVRPPQSKADNPNIDYNLGTVSQSVTDVTGEDFATTCGHSRESGGFLLGDGSKDAPYEVSTAMQLAHAGSHLASHFIQTADIDISTEGAVAIDFPTIGTSESPFEGVFDGKGFTISKLRIASKAESVGLFGVNKGVIQNVHVSSGDVSSTSASPSFAGGIAGLNYDGGQIRSCSNGASVNGSQNTRTGGIAGGNYDSRIHDCYNYGKIAGGDVAGGIAGLNRQGASITGSYNAGGVNGDEDVGAVAGINEDGTIANCYYLEGTWDYGIGYGDGTALEKTSKELASTQMAADLSAGNESSLWTTGSSTSGYSYPVHRKPE